MIRFDIRAGMFRIAFGVVTMFASLLLPAIPCLIVCAFGMASYMSGLNVRDRLIKTENARARLRKRASK